MNLRTHSDQQLFYIAIVLSKSNNIPQDQLVEFFDEYQLVWLQHNKTNTADLVSEPKKVFAGPQL